MPMRSELPMPTVLLSRRVSATDKVLSWIVATLRSPEFLMVVLFCAVGLWLTFYLLHSVPNFGEIVASFEELQ